MQTVFAKIEELGEVARSDYYNESRKNKEEGEYIKKFEIGENFAIKYVEPENNIARLFTRPMSKCIQSHFQHTFQEFRAANTVVTRLPSS